MSGFRQDRRSLKAESPASGLHFLTGCLTGPRTKGIAEHAFTRAQRLCYGSRQAGASGKRHLVEQSIARQGCWTRYALPGWSSRERSEEHTSELQSQSNLVCRLLLEKKKNITLVFIHQHEDLLLKVRQLGRVHVLTLVFFVRLGSDHACLITYPQLSVSVYHRVVRL